MPSLLESEAAYIGVIGSKRRWLTTVKALKDQGVIGQIDQEGPFADRVGIECGNAGGDRGQHHGGDFDDKRQGDGKVDEGVAGLGVG